MKISHRIILVNLVIVAIVLGSAAIAFYSIMYSSLSSQQSQNILNSNRNLTFTYRSFLNNLDEEFLTIKKDNPNFLSEKTNLSASVNDFILEADQNKNSDIIYYSAKALVYIPKQHFTIDEFIKNNPYAIINSYKSESGDIFYFGKIINKDFLNDFAQRIGADIALISDNFTAEVSNPDQNNR
jgi:ABC-type multidrug transport system fused ATPase/permease subunit